MLPLLLAMQASGMVIDYMGTKNQQQFAEMGAKVQQAGIEANIQQTRLETEDASLQALKKLRQDMGTSLAIYAQRGTSSSAGNAVIGFGDLKNNFNADERMRRINLLGRKNELKGQKTISVLQQSGDVSKMWQGFAGRSLKTLSSNPDAWKGMGKSFGLTGAD